ncbi:MAG: HAD family hydrolase [Bacteroidota bacterium]|nr:HAD family hydrolase [Bacteroidota bacterium]
MNKYKSIVFDWGNTLMIDYPEMKGPMCYWDKVSLVDNVKEVLDILSEKYDCFVASNAGDSDTNLMINALKLVDIDRYFKGFYTSIDLGYSKPDLMYFRTILEQTGYSADEIIMVGNDYNKDIVPAKKVGMKTIYFAYPDIIDAKTDDADQVIYNFKDLLFHLA